jgi:DNA repair exonuclease SbcCD nuclease subunit
VEIPIALHEQTLTSLPPKIEAIQSESKEIERRLVTQISETKSTTDSQVQGVLEKVRESENSSKTKFDSFVETMKRSSEDSQKNFKVTKNFQEIS